MRRNAIAAIACLALGGLLILPGAAAAKSGNLISSLAAGACSTEKREIGKKAFAKRYGKKRAMGACAKKMRKRAQNAITSATAECKAELEDYGPEEFYLEWASFEECVADYAAWIMDGGWFEEGDGEGDEEGR